MLVSSVRARAPRPLGFGRRRRRALLRATVGAGSDIARPPRWLAVAVIPRPSARGGPVAAVGGSARNYHLGRSLPSETFVGNEPGAGAMLKTTGTRGEAPHEAHCVK